MPRASRTLGRWQVVVAGQATETQVAYLTAAQARQLAGVPASQKVPDRPLSRNVTGDAGVNRGHGGPARRADHPRDGIDEGLIPWSREATKKRLQRAKAEDRPVPQPVGKRGRQTDLYRRGDLIVWVEAEKKPGRRSRRRPAREDARGAFVGRTAGVAVYPKSVTGHNLVVVERLGRPAGGDVVAAGEAPAPLAGVCADLPAGLAVRVDPAGLPCLLAEYGAQRSSLSRG
jgi:hypothetical protein